MWRCPLAGLEGWALVTPQKMGTGEVVQRLLQHVVRWCECWQRVTYAEELNVPWVGSRSPMRVKAGEADAKTGACWL